VIRRFSGPGARTTARYDEAAAAFQRALALRNEDCRITNELGWTELLAGDLEAAYRHTTAALKLCEDQPVRGALLYNMGRIAEARGDKAGATTYYQRSLNPPYSRPRP